ncbi:DUF3828 domain-containing protein [Microbaculum marinum]|uniref:DUF3828 domain-containing protein n=1 Tax=Microbaculum marinum TaxID=1764581 RepID=A0AAW9RR26_9HYPH
MRRLLASFGLLAALLFSGGAVAQETPDQVVRSIYATYEGQGLGISPADPGMREIFSARLQALLAEEDQRIESDGIGLLDFDVFVDGQDFQVTDLQIGKPQVSGDEAHLDVRFLNFGEPREYRYSFVKESGRWRIDEIETVGADTDWKLTSLLNGG